MLDGALRGARPTVAPVTRAVAPVLRFVHPRPATLAGRGELLTTVRTRLTEPRPTPRTVVLHGLGGVGKTSAMLEYAHRHLPDYDLVVEVPVEDEAAISTGYAELATMLGARDGSEQVDAVAQVHGALAARPGRWLLLLDNVSDARDLGRIVPPAGRGHVPATSRSSALPSAQGLAVPVLDSATATTFLVQHSDGEPADLDAAAALADELGGLPLALSQAAAYVATSGTTIVRYVELLRGRRADLLRRGDVAGYGGSVATTWTLAVERLACEAPEAVAMLRLLACCAPDRIPHERLLACDRDAAGPLVAALRDELTRLDAIVALRRYSLVGPPRGGEVSVHRLVQVVTADALPDGERRAWRAATAALVEAALPADPELPASWPVFAVLHPHARAVLEPAAVGTDATARYLLTSADYTTALLVREEVFHDARDRLGPDHPDTLAAQVRWAKATGHAGREGAARDLFEAVLPQVTRVCGADAAITLEARAEHGDWTGLAGDPVRARDLFAALLPTVRQVLGPEAPGTLRVWLDLGFWTGQAGDPAAARDEYAAFLPIRERVFGPRHAEVLSSRDQYARWVGEAGDPVAARASGEELVPRYEAELGPEHPHTLWAAANLAWFTGQAGDPAGARDRYRDVVAACERVAGPTSHITLVTRNNHAWWTGLAGDAACARDLCAALLPLRAAAFGYDHPDTLVVRRNLARRTGEAGDPVRARDLSIELLAASKHVLGPDHPQTVHAREDVAQWAAQVRPDR